MMKGGLLIASLLVAMALPAPALDEGRGSANIRAQVVYAVGKDFTIVRAGVARTYKVDGNEVVGMAVESGDLIQTGSGTFLELQLVPSLSLIKIAENTSFQIESFGAQDGSVALSLAYGRVRAKVSKLTGSESFRIRTRSVAAGVRGTDFGLDSLATRSAGRTADRAYCFEGELELLPAAPPAASGNEIPVILVKAGELVIVDSSSGQAVMERREIDKEIKAFWSTNDFKGTAVPSASVPAVPSGPSAPVVPMAESQPVPAAGPAGTAEASPARPSTPEVEIRYVEPDYGPFRRAASTKNLWIGASLVFGAIGLGFQSAGLYLVSSADYAPGTTFVMGGTISVGISLAAGIVALLINPPSP